jgi:uncharacterized membrane protein YjjP (DUF1212 family)
MHSAAGSLEGTTDTMTMHRVAPGLNVNRLEACVALALAVETGEVSAGAADAELIAIVERGPLYSLWVHQMAYGVVGAACALLFYGGSFGDALLAGGGGLLVGGMCWAGSSLELGQSLEFVASMVIAILTRVFATYVWPDEICFFSASLGALVWLFPGLGILNAVVEISGSAPISGTARMFRSLLIMLMIGFGLAIGSRIGNIGGKLTSYDCASGDSTAWYVKVVSFFLCSLGYAVLQNIRLQQLPGAMVTQVTGYLVATFMPPLIGDEGAIVMAAMSVGLVATLIGYIRNRPPYSNVVAGIVFLLPGALGIRGATAIIDNDYVSATAFGSTMLVNMLSVTIGLSLANTLTKPLAGKHAQRTFKWFMQPVVKLSAFSHSVAKRTRLQQHTR